jgi:Amt family ammonium transporter
VTFIIAMIIKYTIGWRVSSSDEISGIDLSEHSEAGYDLSPVYYTNKVQRTLVLSKDDMPETTKTGASK